MHPKNTKHNGSGTLKKTVISHLLVTNRVIALQHIIYPFLLF